MQNHVAADFDFPVLSKDSMCTSNNIFYPSIRMRMLHGFKSFF